MSQTLCCLPPDAKSTDGVGASETCGKNGHIFVPLLKALPWTVIPVLLGNGYQSPDSYALGVLSDILAMPLGNQDRDYFSRVLYVWIASMAK